MERFGSRFSRGKRKTRKRRNHDFRPYDVGDDQIYGANAFWRML